ncbi:hypothetical protein OG689_35615 [Kitasatospora sp. NBC_00240]|uniref:hypothetical protein n=1 Tax=Kitasatospora sp. NBC_00240 TaxID=2903567 RepID=UPI002254893C|nr:hypothetical protein [Kitasatospora sp. NBC_00240]MCX5214529.1 hypothetical protein [Kitasatospora sp. NBC_00240]
MTRSTSWLLLDETGAAFPGVGSPSSSSLLAVRLAPFTGSAGTTEWLRYREITADRVQVLSRSGEVVESLPCGPAEPVWTHLPFDVRADARRFDSAGGDGTDARPRLVPAFLVTEQVSGAATRTHVYSCSRIRESGLLFSRIWAGEIAAGASPVEAVRVACAEQPVLLHRFTDEVAQTTRFESEVEIELKLTLLTETSPWEIASGLAEAVQHRQLARFVPDLGNELQRWTYEQDTFEVHDADGRNGYVAFMKDPDGTFVVKYKFFDEDALRRIEKFDEGIRLDSDRFADYIRSALPGVRLRRLPHLVRTRFDVNVESAATGHFFGLETDEVRANGRVLRQLEIEYHKTRACYGAGAETIEPELNRLADEAQRLLDQWGVKASRGYLSKLTFLKDVATVD